MNNDLFSGIREEELSEALSYLQAEVEEYRKGDRIIELGAKVRPGIILQGEAKISYYDESMNSMAIDHLLSGTTFGHAAANVDGYKAQIELVAITPCTVLRIDLTPFTEIGGDCPKTSL